jgi:hypothetical protein
MSRPAIRVDVLPAGFGDSLLIERPVGRRTWRMLVDTGPDETYPALRTRLAVTKPDRRGRRRIDLVVVSHIDHDHIGGVVLLLADALADAGTLGAGARRPRHVLALFRPALAGQGAEGRAQAQAYGYSAFPLRTCPAFNRPSTTSGHIMITLPEHVLQADEGVTGFSWEGESPHPQYPDEMVPNKETAMDWAEHQRIVCNARKLLTSWTPDKHTGKVKDAFKALNDAYNTSGSRSVMRVSKGIHQPETNAHLQLRVVTEFGSVAKGTAASVVHTFHLDVAATEVKGVDGLDDRFQWEGVQFSYKNAARWECWPALAVVPRMKNSTASRRLSISAVALAAHQTALAEARKEKERLDAQATLEGQILKALAVLEEKEGLTLRKLKNEPPARFWKGTGKAFVVNRYGKGHYVEWNAKTQALDKVV